MSPKTNRYARNREAIKQETRQALLDAAATLFARRGIDASLDDICAEAGYTRGAFYVHFENRDDLLAQVMERTGMELLDTLLGPEDAPDADLSALAARLVKALVQGQLPLSGQNGIRFHQFMAACARSPRVKQQYQHNMKRARERIGKVLQHLQEQERLRKEVDTAALAAVIITLVMGAQALTDMDVEIPMEEGSRALLQLLLH